MTQSIDLRQIKKRTDLWFSQDGSIWSINGYDKSFLKMKTTHVANTVRMYFRNFKTILLKDMRAYLDSISEKEAQAFEVEKFLDNISDEETLINHFEEQYPRLKTLRKEMRKRKITLDFSWKEVFDMAARYRKKFNFAPPDAVMLGNANFIPNDAVMLSPRHFKMPDDNEINEIGLSFYDLQD